MIDTHKMVIGLEIAGFTKNESEALVDLLKENNQIASTQLATKEDTNIIKTDVELIKKDVELIRNELGFLRWFLSLGFAALALLILIVKL